MAIDGFEVAGVRLPRPFRVRRLGHFHFLTLQLDASLAFYRDLMGFQVADKADLGIRVAPEDRHQYGDLTVYFMRYGSDHHSFILSDPVILEILAGRPCVEDEIGQITWQVGSLREVIEGNDWLDARGMPMQFVGRDAPGSNWHSYFTDPDGRTNELFYGIEQIGWDGLSKPKALSPRPLRAAPQLPHIPEYQEVQQAREAGTDLGAGTCSLERLPATYDVDGVLLPRPFKIIDIGPVRLFTKDMDQALAFYRDTLGMRVTETVTYNGHTCYFLRAGSEHHSIALYPEGLCAELGLSERRTLAFGVRLHGYRQLRDAIGFLREHGTEFIHLPQELFPGVGHTIFAIDPAGHLLQLYTELETVGWDGKPRPAASRSTIDNTAWPDVLENEDDVFSGQPFFGPWG